MPNYKLSDYARQEIYGHAKTMLGRIASLHQSGYPLSHVETLQGLVTPDHMSMLQELGGANMVVSRAYAVTFSLKLADNFASQVRVNRKRTDFPVFNDDDKVHFQPDNLPADRAEALRRWADNAARWVRRIKVADDLINKFINGMCGDSMASLRTRWPAFATVVVDMPKPWPERIREATGIRRSEYDWPREGSNHEHYQWYLDHMEKLEAVGGVLAQAAMLSRVADAGETTATIYSWTIDGKRALA